MMMGRYTSLFLTVFIIIFSQHLCFSNDVQPIKLGSTNGFSTDYEFTDGINLYLKKINARGGIGGRQIEFIALNDDYNPNLAAKNVHQLIEKDKVLCLAGCNGTPSLVATIPIVNKERVLLYGTTSFSPLLRIAPPDRYVINFRVGSKEILEEFINGIYSIGIKPEEIAFISQNDANGFGEYTEFLNILKKKGYEKGEQLAYGVYDTIGQNVESAFAQIVHETRIKNFTIKVIYLHVTFISANSKAISLVQQFFPDAIVFTEYNTVDWVLEKEIVDKMHASSIKAVTCAPVPFLSSDLPAIREFHEDLKKYSPDKLNQNLTLLQFTLEGYLLTKLLVIALEQASATNKLTREGIIDVFETFKDVDIGIGVKISISKDNHQALHQVWPGIFKKDQFVPLDWSELKAK